MSILPYEFELVSKKLVARCRHEIEPNSPLIVGVPGGPGISGKYLDQFIGELGDRYQMNTLVLDLPNHSSHPGLLVDPFLNYPGTVEILRQAFEALSQHELIVLAHSFGARLMIDLFSLINVKINFTVMMSLPASYETSTEYSDRVFKGGLSNLKIGSEEDFAHYWKGILPFYFHESTARLARSPTLTDGTCWEKTTRMTEMTPTIEDSAARVKGMPTSFSSILYLEGADDLRLAFGNVDRLKKNFLHWEYQTLSNTGHFPMLERPENCPYCLIKR